MDYLRCWKFFFVVLFLQHILLFAGYNIVCYLLSVFFCSFTTSMYIYQCYRVEKRSLKTWTNVKIKNLNIIISTYRYVYTSVWFLFSTHVFITMECYFVREWEKKNSHYYFQLSFYNVVFFFLHQDSCILYS